MAMCHVRAQNASWRMIHAALPVIDPLIEGATLAPACGRGAEWPREFTAESSHCEGRPASDKRRYPGITSCSRRRPVHPSRRPSAALDRKSGRTPGSRPSVLRPFRPLALGSAVLLRWSRCLLLVLLLLLLLRPRLGLFLAWRGRLRTSRVRPVPAAAGSRSAAGLRRHAAGTCTSGPGARPAALRAADTCSRSTAAGTSAAGRAGERSDDPIGPSRCGAGSTRCPSVRPSAAADRPATRESTGEVPGSSAPGRAAGRPEPLRDRCVPTARCTRSSHTSCRTGRPSTCRRRRSSSNSSAARSRPGSPGTATSCGYTGRLIPIETPGSQTPTLTWAVADVTEPTTRPSTINPFRSTCFIFAPSSGSRHAFILAGNSAAGRVRPRNGAAAGWTSALISGNHADRQSQASNVAVVGRCASVQTDAKWAGPAPFLPLRGRTAAYVRLRTDAGCAQRLPFG